MAKNIGVSYVYGFGTQKLRTSDERDIKKVDYGLTRPPQSAQSTS